MKKFVIFGLLLIIIGIISYFLFFNEKKLEIEINTDIHDVEVNTETDVEDFVSNIKNGKLINGSDKVDTSKLGKIDINIKAIDNDEKEVTKTITINIIDTTPPIINNVKDITITSGEKIDLLKDITVTDNSNEKIEPTVEGEYDINKAGTYNLKYVAIDSSNNKTEEKFTLTVNEKKTASTTTNNNKNKYYVKVNKTQNVTMVYEKDANGEYTKLVKTFVISAGDNTPIGTFKATDRYETLSLVGKVYGHYTVRIRNDIWFHSVPYYSKPTKSNPHWNDLEYEEYNKLGNLASKGCIRLAVADAKWIYDNVAYGTVVEIYESDELPEGVIKPTPIHIDVNSENRGWDPTDPDPENPWNK